ncbi:MAG TPA: phosphonoacetaldehyde hydrolase [Ktedonobacteraceae bacterium]|jgi:phosphonoacetaldehyde hydrolase|nr:phosphonoacetaldehyde hydrolase [Ktedonobacteraceae bacterium]
MIKKNITNKIQAVIFDWSGTMVDFGSLAPVQVFSELFATHGVTLSAAEVRAPMGMLKRDHIRALLEMERVAAAWQSVHGAPANEQTIDALNAELEQHMPSVAARYVKPIPGAVEALQRLRARSIRIGSTTGYTRETMNAVRPAAREMGIEVEALSTSSSSEVPAGRPAPWMIYRNCMELGIYPPSAVVKVGDTLQDIYEGKNAGAWAIGVVIGSSLLGLSEEAFARLDAVERERCIGEVRETFFQAGAHDVIDSLDELDRCITAIERRLVEERDGETVRR